MSYTAPSTAIAGAVATAGMWNTDLRDNIVYLYGQQGIFPSQVRFAAVITPTLVATQDNWNPTGLATSSRIRLDPTAGSLDITGIAAQPDGTVYILTNVHSGANTVTIKTEHSSSTSTNRFTCPGAADVVLNPRDSMLIFYNGTRWAVCRLTA